MFIKTGQRVSQHWKEAWRAYCSTYGQNFSDPARYDDTFLVGFIDWAGRLTEANLSPVVPQQQSAPSFSGGGPPRKRPSEGAGGPPAKRQGSTRTQVIPTRMAWLRRSRSCSEMTQTRSRLGLITRHRNMEGY